MQQEQEIIITETDAQLIEKILEYKRIPEICANFLTGETVFFEQGDYVFSITPWELKQTLRILQIIMNQVEKNFWEYKKRKTGGEI